MKTSMRLLAALGLAVLPIHSAAGLTAAEQADSFYQRGLACDARGDLEAAANCYALTVRANPSHPTAQAKLKGLADAFVTRGVAAEKAAQLFAAEKSYKQALRLDAAHAAAKNHLSELETKLPEARRKEILAMRLPTYGQSNVPFEAVIGQLRQMMVWRYRENRGFPVSIEIRDPSRVLQQARITTRNPGNLATLESILNAYCAQANARYQIDNTTIVISPKPIPVAGNDRPPQLGDGSSPGRSPAGPLPFNAQPAWLSKDGKTIKADLVGLDGEAVVVRKDGKEVTIAFAKLSNESVAQAKRMYLPKSDILLYYDFSDGGGTTVKDRSGNGRDGILMGFDDTAAGAGDVVRTSGWTKSGSLNFDGKDDHVSTPLTVSALAGGSFTLEAVITHNNVHSFWSPIIATNSPDYLKPGVIQLGKIMSADWVSPPSAWQYRLNDLSVVFKNSTKPTSLCDGIFHHLALVHDTSAREVRVYFDHQLQERSTAVTGTLSGNANLLIGAVGWSPNERWFGLISEIRISKQALTPAQFLPNPNPSDPVPPVPVHRYSFSGDAKDSIGTAHGKVVDPGNPTARFTNGRLDITANQGEASNAITEDAYVDLPNGIVSCLKGTMTFEVWCTVVGWRTWENIFCFGRSKDGENISGNDLRPPFATIGLNSRNQGNDIVAFANWGGNDARADSGKDVVRDVEHHFALVVDPAAAGNGSLALYMDGYLLATGPLPPNISTALDDLNNWLGRSQTVNPVFAGFYNEFRIYDKSLTAREVLSSYLAGPDVVYGSGKPKVPAAKAGATR